MVYFFSTLGSFLLWAGCAVLGVIYAFLIAFKAELPDYKVLALYEPAVVTRLYATDGQLLKEYSIEKRIFVPITAIPEIVKRAFLSAEDKNFYHHVGIDFYSLIRAMKTNIMYLQEDKRLIGASTITQQLARNFFLDNEKSLKRKIKEAILAFFIDSTFEKDHILELYLNQIYLGLSSYGVAAAALQYFNKPLDALTVAEAAFLACLPKAPNNYHPIKYPKRAKERRDWVVHRLLEDGVIDQITAEQACAQDIVLNSPEEKDSLQADHAAEEVRRQLMNLYGESVLYKGGLVIHTTIDPKLQELAEKTLRQGLISYDQNHGWRGPLKRISKTLFKKDQQNWNEILNQTPICIDLGEWCTAIVLRVKADQAIIGLTNGTLGSIALKDLQWARSFITVNQQGPKITHPQQVLAVGDVIAVEKLSEAHYALRQVPQVNGGLVALDPHTGRILALVGGFSYKGSEFNRVTQALRQPGSAFKPFVYLTALEQGLPPNLIIEDAPIVMSLGYGLGQWKPRNITRKFYGPRPMRFGLEKSLNPMTVRLGQRVGIKKIAATVKRFGVMEKMPPYLAMVLGAGETTMLKLLTGYAIIANGGKKVIPSLIDVIQDRQGRIVFKHDQRTFSPVDRTDLENYPLLINNQEQIADPVAVYQVISMLEGAVQRGSVRIASRIGKPLAAKSGTTNECMDAWCIGFSPYLLVGVYVGFDTPSSLGEHETGSRVAAPIFTNFMEVVLKDAPAVPFNIPAGVRLIPIHLDTGKVVTDQDHSLNDGIIYESFRADQDIPVATTEIDKGIY